MAKISLRVISSSSQQNCIVLYDGDTHLFLDLGVPINLLKNYINKYNVSIKKIAACLLTHYHKDHILGIGSAFSENLNIYSSNETFKYIKETHKVYFNWIENKINIKIKNNKWTKIGKTNWKFKWFKTIHNAHGSLGFLIKNRNKKILYFTDSEYFKNKLFRKNNAYIVECNYGTNFMENKQKENKHIKNKINHMNLDDIEKFLKEYASSKTKLFLLSHLSSKSNKNELVNMTINQLQKIYKINIKYLKPNQILDQEFEI